MDEGQAPTKRRSFETRIQTQLLSQHGGFTHLVWQPLIQKMVQIMSCSRERKNFLQSFQSFNFFGSEWWSVKILSIHFVLGLRVKCGSVGFDPLPGSKKTMSRLILAKQLFLDDIAYWIRVSNALWLPAICLLVTLESLHYILLALLRSSSLSTLQLLWHFAFSQNLHTLYVYFSSL